MTNEDETDETMNCGLSVSERDLLQMRLSELGDTMPPREVWQRIESQARAEGLFRPRFGEGSKWFAGTGIAAAVVLAVLNLPFATTVVDQGSAGFESTPPPSVAENQSPGLDALMVQSQEIERDLRSLRVQPSVMQASTVATIADLEDRIATIDYWLSHPDMTPEQAEVYWRERVRLMNTLLSLRRAQAQKMAF
jgi:hypothetical protein